MGFDLERVAQGAALSRREERGASRDLARLERRAALGIAETRALEAVECAKVEAIGAVGAVALSETACLSLHEAAYVARDPHAAARLSVVADEATVAIAARLQRFGRSLG